MENFMISLNAIIPFLLYLGLGYCARRRGVFDEKFANKFNNVVFRLFFPCLTFNNIYNAEMEAMPGAKLIAAIVISLFSLIGLLCLIVPRIVKVQNRKGVVVQAIFRSNVLMYTLPLTASLFGDESSAVASVVVIVCVTIYNIMAVIVLEAFNGEGGSDIRKLLINVTKNPLLRGAVLGLVLFALNIRIPASVEKVVSAFANMTSPLALFILGSTLQFPAIKKNIRYIASVLTIKMMVIPTIMLALGLLLGLRGAELFMLVMVYATPVATASYPMSQNMGGDGELAGQLVMLSSVLALFTLFFWIFLMKSLMLI